MSNLLIGWGNSIKRHRLLIKRTFASDKAVIDRCNVSLQELDSLEQDLSPRIGGFWAGQVEIIGDWDEADKKIEATFEESEIFPSRVE